MITSRREVMNDLTGRELQMLDAYIGLLRMYLRLARSCTEIIGRLPEPERECYDVAGMRAKMCRHDETLEWLEDLLASSLIDPPEPLVSK